MGKLIGLVLLIGGFLVWRRWRKLQSSRAKRKFAFQTIVIGLLILIVLLAISGRIHPLGAVFAAVLAMLKIGLNLLIRWFPLFARLYGASHAQPRVLKTPIIEVEINFATAQVSGKVIDGPNAGKPLDSLTEDELEALLNYCRAKDKKSTYLLQMYLARRFHHQDAKNGSAGNSSAGPTGSMSIEEAAEILGISPEADKDEINQAHRRLIGKVHPDKGGSDYLASLLNNARDLLLNKE